MIPQQASFTIQESGGSGRRAVNNDSSGAERGRKRRWLLAQVPPGQQRLGGITTFRRLGPETRGSCWRGPDDHTGGQRGRVGGTLANL
ncbi:unnamed protein product, partial [Pylaiella littoralis]